MVSDAQTNFDCPNRTKSKEENVPSTTLPWYYFILVPGLEGYYFNVLLRVQTGPHKDRTGHASLGPALIEATYF
jgi:hypothetical protein